MRPALRLLTLFLLIFCPMMPRASGATLRVAAASDLQKAFAQLGPLFEKESGAKVEFVFGSTGLLTRQAGQGAPFDLLFAANESYIADLEGKGKVVAGTRALYAVGRVVIWTRKGSPSPRSLADLKQPTYRRIAIANPEHAPYGAAAREALRKSGVWAAIEPRIVYGENVQQALKYGQTGNAEAALVALSVAIGAGGEGVLVPSSLHAPILQAAAVLTQSKEPDLARRFIAFVVGPRGQKVMRAFGFTLPRGAK
jgi:molybdate transport system substrate-binding protein